MDCMKTIGKAVFFSIVIIALSSCSTLALKPTSTPTPTPVLTATSLPTATPTPLPTLTPTIKPTETPLPPTETASIAVLPRPTGKPVSSWNGIPVMPEAIAGNGDSQSYTYIVKASQYTIVKYYTVAMAKLGWNMFATGQGSAGALMLLFMKGSTAMSISIIPQPDDLMYILIAK